MVIELLNEKTNKVEKFSADKNGIVVIPPGTYKIEQTLKLPLGRQIKTRSVVKNNVVLNPARRAISIDKASVQDIIFRGNTFTDLPKSGFD